MADRRFTLLPHDTLREEKRDADGTEFALCVDNDEVEIYQRGQCIPVPEGAETVDYISMTLDRQAAQELSMFLKAWLARGPKLLEGKPQQIEYKEKEDD